MSASKRLLDFCRSLPNPSTNSCNKNGVSLLLRQIGKCLLVPEELDPVIKFYIVRAVHFLSFCILTNEIC
jgi:hypothetical protein